MNKYYCKQSIYEKSALGFDETSKNTLQILVASFHGTILEWKFNFRNKDRPFYGNGHSLGINLLILSIVK